MCFWVSYSETICIEWTQPRSAEGSESGAQTLPLEIEEEEEEGEEEEDEGEGEGEEELGVTSESKTPGKRPAILNAFEKKYYKITS